MSKKELAMELFDAGYNCAQAVLLAFSDDLDLSPTQAAKIALPFGGGMGQLREVCGALSGAFMVLGLRDSASAPPVSAEKAECYTKVREMAETFRLANGSILCRELLAQSRKDKPKNCRELVGNTAEQLDHFIQKNKS